MFKQSFAEETEITQFQASEIERKSTVAKANFYEEQLLKKLNLLVQSQSNRPQNDLYQDDILINFKNNVDQPPNKFQIKWPPKLKPKQDGDDGNENTGNVSQQLKRLRTIGKSSKSKNQKANLIEESVEKQIQKQLEIMGNHIQYQSLTQKLERYQFTQEDLLMSKYNQYLSEIAQQVQNWKDSSDPVTINSYFIENNYTGDKYLTVEQSQSQISPEDSNQIATINSLTFLKFDVALRKFIVFRKILLDVLHSQKNTRNLQNKVFNQGEEQFFLKKKVITNNENKKVNQLQLFSFNFKKASDFDFLGGRENEENFSVKNRDIFIELPDDMQIDLKNIEYFFLQDSNSNVNIFSQQQDNNAIQKQYVLVKSRVNLDSNIENQIILIYSLKDTSVPALRFENGEMEDIQQGFFTQKDDSVTILTLKSSQDTHYEIEYSNIQINNKRKEGDNYQITKDKRIKIGKIPIKIQTEFSPNCQIFHIEATLHDKKFDQSYSLLSNGQIDLIYPLQSQEKPPADNQNEEDTVRNSDYDSVINQIKKQLGIEEDIVQDQWAVFYYNQKFQQFKVSDEIRQFIQQIALNRDQLYSQNRPALPNIQRQAEPFQSQVDNQQIQQSFSDILSIRSSQQSQISSNELGRGAGMLFSELFSENTNLQDKLQKFNMIMTKDIIVVSSYAGILDILYFDENQIQGLFQDCKKQALGGDNNKTLLKRVLDQFDWKNEQKRKVYQDNYNYDNKTNNFNEYIDSFYMNKDKYKVFSTHDKVFVNDEVFQFDQGSVIMDLGSNLENDKDRYFLINLYSPIVKDVKLVKYHKTETNVLFVFMHRNYTVLQDLQNLKEFSGVYFFVLKKVQDIKIDSHNNIFKKFILDEKTTIFIPMELDNIVKTFYSNQEILKYEKNSQSLQGCFTSNLLEFETIRDFKDPTNQWLPFIFHHNVAEGRFELYMCFLNIENIQFNYQNQDDGEDQIDFAKQIQAFKMDFYQSSSDPLKLEDVSTDVDNQSYRKRVYQLGPRALGKFSRCSNWMRTVENYKKTKESEQYSARFQIGSDVNFGFNPLTVEIKEFLVTFDKNEKIAYNDDQKVFRDPSFKENELNSNILITQIQQRYAVRSDIYKNKEIRSSKFMIFGNDRLIPNLDDDGNIKSSFLLINTVQTQEGILQITDDEEKLKNSFQQRIDELKNHQQNSQTQIDQMEKSYTLLRDKLGQYFLVKKIESTGLKETFSYDQLKDKLRQQFAVKKIENLSITGTFSDGKEISNIDFQMIQDAQKDENDQINQDYQIQKREIEIAEGQIDALNNPKRKKNPEFVYDLMEIKDSNREEQNIFTVCGPLVKFNTKIFSFMNQPNNKIYLCSVMFFNNDVITKRYFDKKESIYWMYYFSKILLSTSFANFFELVATNIHKRIDRYFQPRFVLNQQNFCNIEFELFATNISRLKEAFSLSSSNSNSYNYLENSVIHLAIMEKQNFKLELLQNFVNLFKVDSFFSLQYDFLRFQSVIERAIDKKYFKAVTYLVDYMLNPQNSNYSFQQILMNDLPQLMHTEQVNINEFFDLSVQEEAAIIKRILSVYSNLNIAQDQPLVNIEQFLINKKLPEYGTDETDITFIQEYKGPFWTKDEVCQILITHQQQKELKEIKILENKRDKDLDEDETTDLLVQIQFSLINFQPVIRKIKIDKILNRKAKRSKNTQYLNLFDKDPNKIISMNHLVLASLIAEQFNNPEFMVQSTAQKIILEQFDITRPYFQGILLTYLFGFFIPFCFNCFMVSILNDKDKYIVSQIEKDIIIFFHVISSLTQILFAVFELAQMKYSGFQTYFSDWWNLFDCSQFIGFIILSFIRISQNSYQIQFGLLKLLDNFICILIICQGTTKILYLIRVKDDYSFLVQMVSQVMSDLVPFIVFLMIFIFLFSLVCIIMNQEISSDGDDSFNNLPFIIRVLIQVFRNSIGDIALPNYGQWNDPTEKADDFERAQPFAFFIIWFFWISNLFLMLIVLLNFLIAKVGQTYEDVNEKGQSFLNMQKAQLNLFVFQILQFFGKENQFIAFAFKQPLISRQQETQSQIFNNQESEQTEEFENLAKNVKEIMTEEFKNLKKELMIQNHQVNNGNLQEIQSLKDKIQLIIQNDQINNGNSQEIQSLKEKIETMIQNHQVNIRNSQEIQSLKEKIDIMIKDHQVNNGNSKEIQSLKEKIETMIQNHQVNIINSQQIQSLKEKIDLMIKDHQVNNENAQEIQSLKEKIVEGQKQSFDVIKEIDKNQAEILNLLKNQN